MRFAIVLTLIYSLMALLQPLCPSFMGEGTWLLGITPLLVVYCALHAPAFSLICFIIAGGLLHDAILLHYFGMGPLLWGLTAFLVRSQKPWLEASHKIMTVLICFVASFFYLAADRLFFLVYNGFWSWNLELSYSLLKIATINTLISPLLFWIFDFLFGERMRGRERFSYA